MGKEKEEKKKQKDKVIKKQNNMVEKEKSNIIIGRIAGFIVAEITIIGAAVGVARYCDDNFEKINIAITKLEDNNKILDETANKSKDDIEKIKSYLYEDDGVKDQLGNIQEALNLKIINVSEDSELMKGAAIQDNDISRTTASFTSDTQVGVDSEGKVYIAEELLGETILLTFQEDGKEVFFLGQYNENYNWDGYCITNVYQKNGTLWGLCESNFKNGTRSDYKSFYLSNSGNWVYTNRKCEEKGNSGETIVYKFVADEVKIFTKDNVRISDIKYVDDVLATSDVKMYQYYHGYTLNGHYEDNTGNAYFVSYSDDGVVDCIYHGNFIAGKWEDNTGNAWEIKYDSSNTRNKYFYYKGTFVEGRRQDDTSLEYVTQEEIETIIRGLHFPNELKWKQQ